MKAALKATKHPNEYALYESKDSNHARPKDVIKTPEINIPANPIFQLYENNKGFIEKSALNASYLGIGLHGAAALFPFLKFMPKPLTTFADRLATFYSRYLSGIPMIIFSIPQFIAKDSIKAIAQLSAAFSFPFIKTVENMPIGSSFFCGVKTAIEAIQEHDGPKVVRKSDSLLHQAEEFGINFIRMWKSSLSKIGSANASLQEKFKLFCNLIFLPGYSVVQGLGMKFCRDRISDQNNSGFLGGLTRWTRTDRGILGVFTDLFLLGSKRRDLRTVGQVYAGSSVLSLIPPWVDKIFSKHPAESREKIVNVVGQVCKALDELGNVLWSKIPHE